MISRGDPTDDEWAPLKPLLPVSNNRCGRWRDHHQVINGSIHRLGTGMQWRELPERFGPWQTVHKRHALRSAGGAWEMPLQHVQSQVDAEGGIDLGRLGRLHRDACPPAHRRSAEGGSAIHAALKRD
ncbi:transposase [Streptomyces sp. NPDC001732]